MIGTYLLFIVTLLIFLYIGFHLNSSHLNNYLNKKKEVERTYEVNDGECSICGNKNNIMEVTYHDRLYIHDKIVREYNSNTRKYCNFHGAPAWDVTDDIMSSRIERQENNNGQEYHIRFTNRHKAYISYLIDFSRKVEEENNINLNIDEMKRMTEKQTRYVSMTSKTKQDIMILLHEAHKDNEWFHSKEHLSFLEEFWSMMHMNEGINKDSYQRRSLNDFLVKTMFNLFDGESIYQNFSSINANKYFETPPTPHYNNKKIKNDTVKTTNSDVSQEEKSTNEVILETN